VLTKAPLDVGHLVGEDRCHLLEGQQVEQPVVDRGRDSMLKYVQSEHQTMLDDGDTILRLVGVALVLGVVFAGGVVALQFDPPERDGGPDAAWTVERLNDTHVRVTHDGGEPVRTENLHVTVDGLERATDFADPVAPGDSTVVPASDDALVRVAWEGGRTEREIMASARV